MRKSTTPPRRPRAYRVRNAVCPRCDGPLYFVPATRAMICTTCPKRKPAAARVRYVPGKAVGA